MGALKDEKSAPLPTKVKAISMMLPLGEKRLGFAAIAALGPLTTV